MSDESRVDDPVVDPQPSNGAPKRRGKLKKRHTVARVLTLTILVMSMVVALFVVYSFRHLSGNLTAGHYEDQLENRPDKVKVSGPAEPLNVLVMGSDTRAGEGNDIDNETGGGGSDTTILIHLSADREHAYGISIPRDSMVDRPACDHGAIPAASYQMWNTAFAVGGPGCTMQQFEQLTGVRIDHYVVVDFNGFQGMVDAIGGVQVCVPEEINDQAHGIHLPAGTYDVSGRQALSYVRQRYAVGDGSDIGRMKRQQAFIASMANKVISAGTLSRPDRLLRFLDAATTSIKVDRGLDNVGKIAKLGFEFRHINPSNIQFITIPWTWDPNDPNRVVWAAQAASVWKKIANDEPLSKRLTATAINAAKPPGSSDDASSDPADNGRPPRSPSGSPSPSSTAANDAAVAAGLCT